MAEYSPNEEPFPGSAADFYEKNQRLSQKLILARVQNLHLKKLITELCDALEDVLPMKQYAASFKLPYYDLVQRAREAVK